MDQAGTIQVFISYRRDDSLHQTGRLYDRLVGHFGSERVFKDVDSIPLGVDFREVLTEQVVRCDVLLAVIGDTWLSIAGKRGARRLEDPGDFVRIEIEAALNREIPVIPVLVGHQTAVPPAEELPESLRGLSFRNGMSVRPDPDFHKDMDRLIRGIEQGVTALRDRRPVRAPEPVAPSSPPGGRRRPSRPLLVAAAMFGFFLLGVIIYVVTDKGRITLVVNDPKAVVKIDGGVVRIEDLGEPITLRAGDHALDVTWGDGAFQTRKFVVRRGDDERLRVECEPTARKEPIASEKKDNPPRPGDEQVAAALRRRPEEQKEAAPPAPTSATKRDATVPPKPGPGAIDSSAPPREITNTIGMKLVLIPKGEFLMGSDGTDPDAVDDEFLDKDAGKKEKHRVRITRPFYLGVTEVTRGQFRQFVEEASYQTDAEKDGKGGYGWNEQKRTFEQDPRYTWRNAGFDQTDEHPVVNVSWNDAVAFAIWLGRKEGQTYRLPTEAEWEYACRAGTTSRFSCGDDPEGLAVVGNIADGTAKAKYPDWTAIAAQDGYVYTAPVGRYKANAWDLFDMHGNVWEWCSDGYATDYYKRSLVDDPPGSEPGPNGAAYRVFHGGSWRDGPRDARSACRYRYVPEVRYFILGFRLAREQSVR